MKVYSAKTKSGNVSPGVRLNGTLVGILLLTLSLAACASAVEVTSEPREGSTTIQVSLTEFRVELDRTVIPAGPVRFLITNKGSIEHNLYLEPVDAIQEPLINAEGLPAAAEGLQPGDTIALDFQFDTVGESFQLACHLPGHYEAGMAQVFSIGE